MMVGFVSLCIALGFAAFSVGVWALLNVSEALDDALTLDGDAAERSRR